MKASLVVLCYNQLEEGTRPCVESIYRFTEPRDFELILVDNASSDGTADYLRQVKEDHDNVKLVLNKKNRGYAGGNNDGMRVAAGDIVVLMNNDTLVTPGWLDELLSPFTSDPKVGLVAPITNSAGNEQMVVIPNLMEGNYLELSAQYVAKNKGYYHETKKLGFFVVAISASALNNIGLMDENFGIGMFEDDDYCMRARKTGYKLMVAEGCFIFHKGSLSFKKLLNDDFKQIFQRNKAYYMQKHGEEWLNTQFNMAYFKFIENELVQLKAKGVVDPELERVMARLLGFEWLINYSMDIERKALATKESKADQLPQPNITLYHKVKKRLQHYRAVLLMNLRK